MPHLHPGSFHSLGTELFPGRPGSASPVLHYWLGHRGFTSWEPRALEEGLKVCAKKQAAGGQGLTEESQLQPL